VTTRAGPERPGGTASAAAGAGDTSQPAGRSWGARSAGEFGYAMSDLPVAIAGFTFVVVLLALGTGLAVTVVGLPLFAAGVLACRGAGAVERARARALLGVEVGEPAPFRPRPGFLGWLRSALGDLTGWRAAVYLLAKFPVGLATFVLAAAFYLAGPFLLLYPVIHLLGPASDGVDGRRHHLMTMEFGSWYADSWWGVLGLFVLGGLLLVNAPAVVRPMVAASGSLVRGLLGPTRYSQRIRDLERTRGRAVDDSAAALRRIERDLHDGAQARLVTVALDLGLAKETLDAAAAGEQDLDQARHLVQAAHTNAKQALTELRDLARGIHPPVLDAGLDDALASLAGRSAVPVALHVHLPFRPSPAIETIAYFCTAELLTNVAKHAGARRALVHVGESAGLLRLTVADDGTGGASPDRGSGLAGLRDRVSAVDGTLHVTSPPRGPTVVTVELPIQA
jgi:signal transduction histidine kinase